MTLLTLAGISKSFVMNRVLTDVDLTLPEYGRMGLVGVNGSGKSTLMKIIAGEEEADEALQDGRRDTLISYVVAPSLPHTGSWCYKMVISAGTHELYYFDRHKIGTRNPAGFLKSDVKQLSSSKKGAVR